MQSRTLLGEILTCQYDPIENIFHGPPPDHGKIPHVMWHITDICGLRCPYCFAPKTGAELNSAHVAALGKKLSELGVQKVDISGGEPLASSIVFAAIECARANGIHATITTGGLAPRTNIRRTLENLSDLSRLILSIDGPTEYLHNSLRGHSKAWSSLMHIIDELSPNERSQKLRINTVVTRKFVDEKWLSMFLRLANQILPREWCLIQPHPANMKPTFEEHDISQSEFDEVCRIAVSADIPIKVLVRQRLLYSSYWCLHPSGILRQHTDGAIDGLEIDMIETSTQELLNAIRTSTTEVPGESQ